MPFTADQLRQIMPNCPDIDGFSQAFSAAMDDGGMVDAGVRAMFLAECAFECNQCRELEEEADGSAYEGRKDLGNIHQGDGKKFKGRGCLQITGRTAYELSGYDRNPESVSSLPACCETAVWFWNWKKNLNQEAIDGDFNEVTRLINGACTMEAPSYQRIRLEYLARAQQALGVTDA
jgi:predicted chitinase